YLTANRLPKQVPTPSGHEPNPKNGGMGVSSSSNNHHFVRMESMKLSEVHIYGVYALGIPE
ncbi:hypothetical protein L9F63_014692, partial [Diploptera punctata]